MHTIYCYTNLINGKKYVGQTITTLQKRAKKDGTGYKGCPNFWKAIQKYGWENFESSILAIVEDQESANLLEENYIKQFNTIEEGYNISKGGSYDKIAKSKYNTPLNNERQVVCVNTKEIYSSIAEATRLTGANHIEACCKQNQNYSGIDKDGYGLIWRYFEEYDPKEKFTFIKNPYLKDKRVICVNTGVVYESAAAAGKKLGIDSSSITACCKGRRKSAGVGENNDRLIWRKYLQEDGSLYQQEENLKIKKGKKIRCVETNIIYDDMHEAAKAVGLASKTGIYKAIVGETNTAKGFHWEYV